MQYTLVFDKACWDAKWIADGNGLHGLKLSGKTDVACRRVGLLIDGTTLVGEHLFFGEIMQLSPIGFACFLGVYPTIYACHQAY